MDLRILAAVLITLSAVGIGMSGEQVNMGTLTEWVNEFRESGDLTEIIGGSDTSQGKIPVQANLASSETVSFKVSSPAGLRLHSGSETQIFAGDSEIQLEENGPIDAHNFIGTITRSSQGVNGTGTIEGVSSSQIDIDYTGAKSFSFESSTTFLSLSGLEQHSFRLEQSSGTVNSNETEINIDGDTVWMQGFAGNITVDGNEYILTGDIDSALLGDAEIG